MNGKMALLLKLSLIAVVIVLNLYLLGLEG
jgi:hypothetical protein